MSAMTGPLLVVEHLTMRFGGSSPSTICRSRPARRDHRADRPERRRQDHGVQLHHRLLQADLWRRASRLPGDDARDFLLERMRISASPSRPRSRAPSRTSGCFPA
jgi:hypothetical protein